MPVEIVAEDQLAIITLNRPEARNAINGEMASTMEACLDEYEENPDLWCAILRAEGTVFSAGADLKEFKNGLTVSVKFPPSIWINLCWNN